MAESEQQQQQPCSVKGHGQSQIHVLMVAFSAFGHVQPMHKLAMQLARRGVLVSLATFNLSFAKLHALHAATPHPNVRIYSLPDELPHDYVFDYIHMLFHVIFHLDGSHLEALLRQLHVTGPPVCHVIYNHFLLWVRPLCRKLGLRHSVFWTMAASVFATCLHFFTNVSELETVGHRKSRTIPGLKNELEEADLPGGLTLSPRYVEVFREQFRDLEKLDWILANSIYELENDAFDLIRSKSINFVGVGPCIGSAFLDENYGTIHGDRDRPGYLKWLDGQQERSVVYVAFGSISTMSREQVEEIAFGIQESGEKFLWVIRGIADMIPKGFAEQTKDQGLMVDWCDDQLQVLFHGSVGAFLSHCGWNSTLESLYAGVPVIAFPIWGDQPMDAKILCEDFRTGIRIQKQKECQNMVGREELARCIKFMLSDQNSEVDQMRKNGQKWKQIATSAMDNGGSSANTLSNFLEDVMHEAKEELCLLSPSSVATACKDDRRM